MPNRNWLAINQLTDPHFRMAVALATDQDILAGLATGFPHLFLEEGEEAPKRIPVAALMEATRDLARQEGMSEENVEDATSLGFDWSIRAVPHLNLPLRVFGEEGLPVIPWELLEQLIGQHYDVGMVVTYEGRPHLVTCIDAYDDHLPPIGGFIKEPLTEVLNLTLVDLELVELGECAQRPIPLSTLQERARQMAREEYPGEEQTELDYVNFGLTLVMDEDLRLDPPRLKFHGPDIPHSILEQLVGQRYAIGMRVTFEGNDFLILEVSHGSESSIAIGSEIPAGIHVRSIVLVRSSYIDLSA